MDNRKADTRRKIELGGIVVKAGLGHVDREVLFGLLLLGAEVLLKSDGSGALKAQTLGKREWNSQTVMPVAKGPEHGPALFVEFPPVPDQEMTAGMAARGFRFDGKRWFGYGNRDEVSAYVARCRGVVGLVEGDSE